MCLVLKSNSFSEARGFFPATTVTLKRKKNYTLMPAETARSSDDNLSTFKKQLQSLLVLYLSYIRRHVCVYTK